MNGRANNKESHNFMAVSLYPAVLVTVNARERHNSEGHQIQKWCRLSDSKTR